jgi:hypothetical protein
VVAARLRLQLEVVAVVEVVVDFHHPQDMARWVQMDVPKA